MFHALSFTATLFALASVVTAASHAKHAARASSILTVPPSEWTALNTAVEGRLYPGIPLARPCFSSYNGVQTPVTPAQTAECAEVRTNYRNRVYRTSKFSNFMFTEYVLPPF